MHHRTRELRAAVARRERSQGQLRAATASVGVAGVVTAGAVAFILPGATHSAASAQTARTPRPAPASSQAAPTRAAASSAKSSGTAGPGHARRHHHRHASQGAAATAPSAAPSSAPAPAPSTAPPQTTSGGS